MWVPGQSFARFFADIGTVNPDSDGKGDRKVDGEGNVGVDGDGKYKAYPR